MRSVSRVTGVARNTVDKLLGDLGDACAEFQNRTLRNLNCQVIEADEIWAYCYAKQKNMPEQFKDTFGYGDVWTWVAIDADTRLIPSWLVGERTVADAYTFLADLRSRLRNARIQLTTDSLRHYLTVADGLWADSIDFAMLHKIYGSADSDSPERTYSPATCTGTDIRVMAGDSDPDRISISYIERQNLTMRMGMRRFTRLTNAFSKKVENHAASVSLHLMHYNFGRPYLSLGKRITPAMAAGVADHAWSVWEIAGLLD